MRKLVGDYGVHIKTKVPLDFFRSHLAGSYEVVPQQTDIGCIHGDFIHIDTKKTLYHLDQFYKDHASRICAETRWLDENKIDLIITDAPGFPLKAAKPLGIPRLLMSNFTWYDIYSAFPEANDWRKILDVIRDEYSCATLQFLPQCHIAGNVIAKKEVVGFIGLRGRNIRNELERLFPSQICGKTIIYIYFGEFGSSSIQWKNLEKMENCVFITPDSLTNPPKNLIVLRDKFAHPDLIASADIVFTKAGYSTLATSLAHGKPIISCDREGFREVDAIKEFMIQNQVGLIIDSVKFYDGDWAESIDAARELTIEGKIRLDGERDVVHRINSLLTGTQ